MGYSYSQPVGGVFSNPVWEVRYRVGDTSPKEPFSLTDEEIEFEAVGRSVRATAAAVAYAMGTRYGAESTTSKSVGDYSIARDYAATGARYMRLSITLRTSGDVGSFPSVSYGATSDPVFTLKQFDNTGEAS